MFKIVAYFSRGENKPIVAFTDEEDDAEEVGAALAMAEFDVQVWSNGKLLHEFFAS